VRIPEDVDSELRRLARDDAASKSSIIVQALTEWVKTRQHPLIHFVSPVPGERRASLVGGPEVWSVAEVWLQHEPAQRTVQAMCEATGLRGDQVEAALAYWAANREEIDDLVERIHEAQEREYAAWSARQALVNA
jgi:hypothetical protein